MYIKIAGALFLMGSAAAIGFIKAEELKERVKILQELHRMILLLQGEFRFHRASLSEAFENVAGRVSDPFSLFLRKTAARLESREQGGFEEVWKETAEALLENDGFHKEDREILNILQSSLGYLDLTMQTETLNLAMIQTEEAVKAAREKQESKGRLYRTMGVTAGALLTLLMI